jgi:S-adenosylmethionine:diacylglycerol 3-amino-3-carboxypropyl transferase
LVTADIVHGLKQQAEGSIDAFALSNVFEYSPAPLFDAGKDEVLRVARSGARIAHRNLLAPRRFGDDPRFVVDAVLSERLRHADRGFIYSHFEAARTR